MSQVVNFEDTDVEKHAIFYRLLLPHLANDPASPDVDLSEMDLLAIKQKHNGATTLKLASGAGKPMKPTTGVGTGVTRNPNEVLLDEVVAELNVLFAGEKFEAVHVRTWVQSLLAAMESNDQIRVQKKVNTLEQFLASPTLRDALMIAIAESKDAHTRLADGFAQRTGVDDAMIRAIGKLFYNTPDEDQPCE